MASFFVRKFKSSAIRRYIRGRSQSIIRDDEKIEDPLESIERFDAGLGSHV
jgi:hypothetical protein